MTAVLRPVSISFVILATLCAATTRAQPTLPRDRGPAVSASLRPFLDRLYSPIPAERAEAACQLGRRRAEAAPAIPVLLSMLGDDAVVPYVECEMSPWLRRALTKDPSAAKWAETSPAKEAA